MQNKMNIDYKVVEHLEKMVNKHTINVHPSIQHVFYNFLKK